MHILVFAVVADTCFCTVFTLIFPAVGHGKFLCNEVSVAYKEVYPKTCINKVTSADASCFIACLDFTEIYCGNGECIVISAVNNKICSLFVYIKFNTDGVGAFICRAVCFLTVYIEKSVFMKVFSQKRILSSLSRRPLLTNLFKTIPYRSFRYVFPCI